MTGNKTPALYRVLLCYLSFSKFPACSPAPCTRQAVWTHLHPHLPGCKKPDDWWTREAAWQCRQAFSLPRGLISSPNCRATWRDIHLNYTWGQRRLRRGCLARELINILTPAGPNISQSSCCLRALHTRWARPHPHTLCVCVCERIPGPIKSPLRWQWSETSPVCLISLFCFRHLNSLTLFSCCHATLLFILHVAHAQHNRVAPCDFSTWLPPGCKCETKTENWDCVSYSCCWNFYTFWISSAATSPLPSLSSWCGVFIAFAVCPPGLQCISNASPDGAGSLSLRHFSLGPQNVPDWDN